MTDLSALYRHRFHEADLPQKRRIWATLCRRFFQELVVPDGTVVDLACGYGEFINNIAAQRKIGVDINADVRRFLDANVEFFNHSAEQTGLPAAVADVVFTSNFLEHMKTKDDLNHVFAEVRRILRSDGRFIVMGPNIRYLADKYWDFYDHYTPLSHLSLEEGLVQAGFELERLLPRFLPYTTKSALPTHSLLIELYLKAPLVWPLLGKQFLAVARKAR